LKLDWNSLDEKCFAKIAEGYTLNPYTLNPKPCGSEAGSYLRRIDSCITQLKA